MPDGFYILMSSIQTAGITVVGLITEALRKWWALYSQGRYRHAGKLCYQGWIRSQNIDGRVNILAAHARLGPGFIPIFSTPVYNPKAQITCRSWQTSGIAQWFGTKTGITYFEKNEAGSYRPGKSQGNTCIDGRFTDEEPEQPVVKKKESVSENHSEEDQQNGWQYRNRVDRLVQVSRSLEG